MRYGSFRRDSHGRRAFFSASPRQGVCVMTGRACPATAVQMDSGHVDVKLARQGPCGLIGGAHTATMNQDGFGDLRVKAADPGRRAATCGACLAAGNRAAIGPVLHRIGTARSTLVPSGDAPSRPGLNRFLSLRVISPSLSP